MFLHLFFYIPASLARPLILDVNFFREVAALQRFVEAEGWLHIEVWSEFSLLRGGRSFLDVLIAGVARLAPRVDFVLNAGDTDALIVPVATIRSYLSAHPGVSFIHRVRPCECFPVVEECDGRVFGVLPSGEETCCGRPLYPRAVSVWHGSHFLVLAAEFVAYVVAELAKPRSLVAQVHEAVSLLQQPDEKDWEQPGLQLLYW